MPKKIFVNYRRDDDRSMAARIYDRLAHALGSAHVFMDVDDLLPGQRFDHVLTEALNQTDVLLAVIGPRWLELLAARCKSNEHDYVREEIAWALQDDGIAVIPVLIDQTPLPRPEALPKDIRNLALHQSQSVTHVQFGRDIDGLVQAIREGRKRAWSKAPAPGVHARRGRGVIGVLSTMLIASLALYRVAYPGREAETVATRDLAVTIEEPRQQKLAQKGPALAFEKAATPAPEVAPAPAPASEKETAQAREGAPPLGHVFRDCSDVCPEMVEIPAGEFMMGSSRAEIAELTRELGRDGPKMEGPQHKVTIARMFAIGKFEVTFAEWDACVAAGGCRWAPSDQGWGRGRRPVVDVSWDDARQYTAWISRKTGETYRLPTEAEWEYAARAGAATRYAFGDRIDKTKAQYAADRTAEVGSFPANRFGLYDMHGNVWEMCLDNISADYNQASRNGSAYHNTFYDRQRVIRGGSWGDSGLNTLRSASRGRVLVDSRKSTVGFRLYRTL